MLIPWTIWPIFNVSAIWRSVEIVIYFPGNTMRFSYTLLHRRQAISFTWAWKESMGMGSGGRLYVWKSHALMDYRCKSNISQHYNDGIMGVMASQITSLTIVYSTVYSGAVKKTSKLRVTGLCAGKSPVTGQFPAKITSNAENVSIWWRPRGHPRLKPYAWRSVSEAIVNFHALLFGNLPAWDIQTSGGIASSVDRNWQKD